RDLFDAATVESLAGRVASAAGSGARPELTAQTRPEQLPLSLAQQRMWFLNRFDPESTAYNIPLAIRLTGVLDVAALQAAVVDVLERHESLRSRYPDSAAGPHQVIVAVEEIDLDLAPTLVAEPDLLTAAGGVLSSGFDVRIAPPVRARLFEVSPTDRVLVMVVHHISADGLSMAPLARDVMTAYTARSAGSAPAWSPLPVQYADYALWQHRVLGSPDDETSVAAQQLAFWMDELADLPAALDLPTDRPRPAEQSMRGARYDFTIDERLSRGVRDLAASSGATPFMVLHAALAVLLARLSGESDIAIGTPVGGRGEAALDDLVGMFVNTLVLRTEVDPSASFADLLGVVRSADIRAFGHVDVPFEQLVEALNPVRSKAHNPLFQVSLSLHNQEQAALELPDLTVRALNTEVTVTQFDLDLALGERVDESGVAAGMYGSFAYATDLFDESTIASFAKRLVRILESVTSDASHPVGDLALLTDGELDRVLRQWNDTAAHTEPTTLVALFDEQVERTPDAVALIFEGSELTYAELDARANRLARALIERGVGPDTAVGLCLHRSFDLLVAMYAIVKAGGAYVPIDPEHPADRIEYVHASSAPVCVLTTADTGAALPAGADVVELDGLDLSAHASTPVTDADRLAPLRPANTAYILYTSGSTGRPKGVAVSHAAITNQTRWMHGHFGLTSDDRTMQKAPITFDVSVWECFALLEIGGSVVVLRPDGHRDPAYIARIVDEHAVTIAEFVPSLLDALLPDDSSTLPASMRHVLGGGEELTPRTARRAAARGAAVENTYGPTEAAITTTHFDASDIGDAAVVPIGRGVWNTTSYVLDARLQPTPVGVAGELYHGGAQLARGYHGRADLTSDRFVANPFGEPGERMYRTGDLVRWNTYGQLEFLGRTDFQVKLRGLRIELGDIESTLRDVAGLDQCLVVLRRDPRVGDQLVAYLVGTGLDIAGLKAHLASRLPSYMVPAAFVVLDEMPVNSSGKLDRTALPAPVFEAKTFRAPSTPVEEIIAATFADLLGVERVGADDDFFELGGNSLIATRVTARLGAALDTTVPVRTLFEVSTVEALAVRVGAHMGAGGRVPLTVWERPDHIPLSLAQQRMWFLNRFDPSSAVNNIPAAIRLGGDLDLAALRAAFGDVIARHEVLRTVYPEVDGVGHQVVLPTSESLLNLIPETVSESILLDRVVEVVSEGFDVAEQVPVRARLFRVDGTPEHVLVLVVHHIAADGVSIEPLTRDVLLAYAARSMGEAPAWAPLPVQYADYTLWQREVLGSEDDPESLISRQVSHWTGALAELPEQLDLPTDRPRALVASGRGSRAKFTIDAELHQALTGLARTHNSTLFMVLHSALSVLLARLSGTSDIAVGTPVAGRGEAELDGLVGMFVNTLVLRLQVESGASFTDLLGQAREVDLAAFGNADVPFERLVEVLNPARSQARHPLFQVALAIEDAGRSDLDFAGLSVAALDFDEHVAKCDLQVTIAETFSEDGTPVGIVGGFTYATDLFDESTITGFVSRFRRVLESVVARPSAPVAEIDILDAAERVQLLSRRGAPDADPRTLPELLAHGASRDPEAVALAFEGQTLTYRELDERSSRLARVLIGRGAGPERVVAVAVRRSIESVLSIWAVAKTGAAFVPVDPTYPAERI
ncbi:amino acid adenylation domain-containing protein, partial [Rhodococcus sp. NPDC058505]|uniref:amino acid adenylation domain-containing protein n=1 Tax=Rhodococcus sp. NPDC058505 TaxID=3346531 RepID=UPI00365EFB91